MKKRIILSIGALLLLLFVVASVAWLSNFETRIVRSLNVDYQNGAMVIADKNFDARVLVPDGDGDYRALTDGEELPFDDRGIVPDSVTPFKIEIDNKTDSAKTANLSLTFTTDDTTILDNFYIDVVFGTQYHVYKCLGEAREIGGEGSGNYILDIYGEGEEISIPATVTSESETESEVQAAAQTETESESDSTDSFSADMSLDCYFYYDKFADASNQAKMVEIEFRLE